MSSTKRDARIAGLWYLAMVVTGPIGLVYMPARIIVDGDALATAANIAAHGGIVRLGIAASIACQVAFVFLVLALERLFQGVSDGHTKQMKALVLVSVPLALAAEFFSLAALELGTGSTSAAMLQVRQQGLAIAGVFWGLWLLPFGLLVIRSGFIPKILGTLLIVGCFSYLVDSGVSLLAPSYRASVAAFLTLPLAAGEISMMLWLLIVGVRERVPARGEEPPFTTPAAPPG